METTRLILRAFRPSDWQDLHEYLSDGEVVRYEPYGPYTEEESRREAQRRSTDPDFWAVCAKDSGKVIGNVYLARKKRFETWELGYVFSRPFHGQGFATEASRALLDHVFRNRAAHRAVAMCNSENDASRRLLERLGFRREGHMRQNVYFRTDGEGDPVWQDTYEYGLLASEWLDPESGRLGLRPLQDPDVPLVRAWLYKGYIRKWYRDSEGWLREIEGRHGPFRFLRHYLVTDGGAPVGFCQYYDCFYAGEDRYDADTPGKCFSIDYLVGEEAYLGRGYGKAVIRLLTELVSSQKGPGRIVVQPERENMPSCKALLGCGYRYDRSRGYYVKEI